MPNIYNPWITFVHKAISQPTQWNSFGHHSFVPGITLHTSDITVLDGTYTLCEKLNLEFMAFTQIAHSVDETIIVYVFSKNRDLVISCAISNQDDKAVYNITVTSHTVGFVIAHHNIDTALAVDIINSY